VSTQDSPLLIPSEEIVLLMQGARVVDLARVGGRLSTDVCVLTTSLSVWSSQVCRPVVLQKVTKECKGREVSRLPSLGRHSKQVGEKGNLTHAVPFFDTLLALLRIFVIQSH
jgi:hypothetical protein